MAELAFTVNVAVPACDTSAGRIRDLNQFTELVRSHYVEALRLFQSPSFARIFLQNKETYLERYHGLMKGNDKSMALEEFLIAAHKKTPVQLTVEKRELQYPNCEKVFADKLVLRRDTWGYGEYEIKFGCWHLCVLTVLCPYDRLCRGTSMSAVCDQSGLHVDRTPILRASRSAVPDRRWRSG